MEITETMRINRIIVQNAMLESAAGLSKKYGADLAQLQLHITDLLHRFTNSALGDTCSRVGRDPQRKLDPSDRLTASSSLFSFSISLKSWPSIVITFQPKAFALPSMSPRLITSSTLPSI